MYVLILKISEDYPVHSKIIGLQGTEKKWQGPFGMIDTAG